MGFINSWQRFAVGLNDVIDKQYFSSKFYTNWAEDVENIIALLKLLPSSKVGRNALATRETFYNATDKLIVFCRVRVNNNTEACLLYSFYFSRELHQQK